MSKESGVIVLGILVAVMPVLGFPESWREAFFIIGGIVLALLGFFLRADHLHAATAAEPRARRGKAHLSPYTGDIKLADDDRASGDDESSEETPGE